MFSFHYTYVYLFEFVLNENPEQLHVLDHLLPVVLLGGVSSVRRVLPRAQAQPEPDLALHARTLRPTLEAEPAVQAR